MQCTVLCNILFNNILQYNILIKISNVTKLIHVCLEPLNTHVKMIRATQSYRAVLLKRLQDCKIYETLSGV